MPFSLSTDDMMNVPPIELSRVDGAVAHYEDLNPVEKFWLDLKLTTQPPGSPSAP
jgi:hypothetical protein